MSSPVPAKTQQLHNFSLPQLKWNKNTNNLHQRRRRAAESPPHRHRSPIRDSDSDQRKDDTVGKSEKDWQPEKDSKAKIFVRLRKSGKAAESADVENESREKVPKKDEIQVEKGGDVENCETEEAEEPKTWNLRPRRAGKKAMNADSKGTIKIPEDRTRGRKDVTGNSSGVAEKEKKPKFSVSLSREEIEEDFLILTGSKPPRKPKRRTKAVQKQLDSVFPGLWLSSVTADSYKVPDPNIKN